MARRTTKGRVAEVTIPTGTTTRRDIVAVAEQNYFQYAKLTIESRALPDARDGLKPVQRRILLACRDEGLLPGRPRRKCATIVGTTLGTYHPHGDSSVYDALVRLAQDWVMQEPLIDGQGNFGSLDGDPAAAYRYTEARLTPAAAALLADLELGVVDTAATYDDSHQEATVLPAALPNLLLNGASGIAVGMATNIPPHNLRELAAAITLLCDRPDVSDALIRRAVPAPDFPTGGTIVHDERMDEFYATGRGRVTVRATIHQETLADGRAMLVVTEFPYGVDKGPWLEGFAEMYRKSRDRRQERQKGTPKRRTTREEPAWSDWVALTRDESDQRGIRVVLELKRGVDGATVAEALYQHGRLEQRLGAQCLALVDGVPEQLPLRRALEVFIAHRLDVIQRRSVALRERAANRRHIVQGLLQAQLNLDKVVRWVREAESPAEARATLIAKLRVDTTQADAILALRLSQLTKLDRHALDAEEAELTATVAQLDSLLGSATQQRAAVRDELAVAVKAFGRTRRTRIATEDVAPVLAVNAATLYLVPDGSMETTPARGGVPVAVSPSHPLWGWTAEGTYAMATPEGWPTAPGAPVIGTWIGPWPADGSLVGIFANGMLKRVACADLVPRGEWAPWITRQPEDRLVAAVVVRPGEDVVVATTDGQGLRVAVADIPAYGLKARGVVGMRLRGAAQVCDGGRLEATEHVVVRTSTGGVLAFEGTEWPRQGRGGIGVRLVQLRADETLEAVATGPLSALWAASTGRGPAKWHSVPSEAETVRRRGATARPGPTGPRQRPGRHQAGS